MNKIRKPVLTSIAFKLITIIVFLFTLSACRELVQDEFPDFMPVPTINSILVAGNTLKVHVSLAGKIEEKQLDYVQNAEVQLYVNELYIENLVHQEKGIYSSQTLVEPLNTYQCQLIIPGYDTITCSNTIPAPSELSGIVHINNAGKNEEGTTYPAIQFTFSNNSQKEQYYEAIIRLFTSDYEQAGQIHTITDPLIQNEGLPLAIFSNELIVGTSYTMAINYTTGSDYYINGSWHVDLYPLIVELRSVSYDYYQYLKKYYLYEIGRFPDIVGGVVTSFPLYSNIENAYGIFAGYSMVVSDTIYPVPQIKN